MRPTSLQHHHERAQPDEGYSEENGSNPDTEMSVSYLQDQCENAQNVDPKIEKILTEALLLPVTQRADVVHTLIPTLPNPIKEQLAKLIEELTHFDPTLYLPNELVLNIFSYLSPEDLLRASRISRGWRARALDEKLWRSCFYREGWVLDREQMEQFEKEYQEITDLHGPKVVEGLMGVENDVKGVGALGIERKGSRKRGRDEAFSDGEAVGSSSQQQRVQPGGDGMEGVEATSTVDSPAGDGEASSTDSFSTALARRSSTLSSRKTLAEHASTPVSPADFKVAPTVFQSVPDNLKISWPYLYKHRRRLEHNWEKRRCTTFQLPSPEFPQEGHDECVYTVQHTSRHLVSGSRDKTIRIWDLTRYRLKCEPLRGHEASVLCLQFDERPQHDIIVSGGSDAFVIIWRFSTGKILKKMTRAHEESVLNLRFDDRYIVTCSKDKTIKIWNRSALPYSSPLIPAHVLSHFNEAMAEGDMIAEYSLLTSLLGHQAAVNAVMIHNNTIVSASGDRTIKSWDLSTGEFRKNYIGHTKGIACVQFDGRRIVSGSSDNTVRIFDAEQCAEVACLHGHDNLVRTVQARFGDLETTTDEELAAQAKQADLEFYKAVHNGLIPGQRGDGDSSSHHRSSRGPHGSRLRNAGSSRPEDMLALGTKVPPGGGGSRWAKIVSGSYDESVLLWKRDEDGNWRWIHKFEQKDVLSSGNSRRRSGRRGQGNATGGDGGGGGGAAAGPSTAVQAQAHHHISSAQGHIAQATQLLQTHQHHHHHTNTYGQGPSHLLPASQMAAMVGAQNHLGQQLQQQRQQHTVHNTLNHGLANQVAQQNTTTTSNASVAGSSTQSQTPVQQQYLGLNPSAPSGTPNPATAAATNAAAIAADAAANAADSAAASATLATANAAPPLVPGPAPVQHHRPPNESNRLFKLQFDARRIVCCSQNKVIVGWDFANGDADLERLGGWSLETA